RNSSRPARWKPDQPVARADPTARRPVGSSPPPVRTGQRAAQRGTCDAADEYAVAPRTGHPADGGDEPQGPFHDRGNAQIALPVVTARLTRSGECRRRRLQPDDLSLRLPSYIGARSANLAKRFRNESFTFPVGPLRCLARWSSAIPWASVSSGL